VPRGAGPAPGPDPAPAADSAIHVPAAGEPEGPKAGAQAPLQGVRLDEDVTLLLPASRPVTPEDIEAVRAAAQPLLRLLHLRRLLGPHPERKTP
jgi:hypothetical protein